MGKQSSSNNLNKQQLEADCGMAYSISVLSGRWKLSILGFLLNQGKQRYSELKRKLPGVSERMLIAQLKELQSDGLIFKTTYAEVPARVEYELTEKGRSLKEMLTLMSDWGEEYRK